MKKKEPRTAVLYARLKKSNLDWLRELLVEFGYKSMSEFLDMTVDELRKIPREKL